jgi:hypothetical protein
MSHIKSFSISIQGLQLSYSNKVLKYDACATCELFKKVGFIEDFTQDNNGEPVILFADSNEPQGFGYELWCYFVKSFPSSLRVAEMLIEGLEANDSAVRAISVINKLLQPLKAA